MISETAPLLLFCFDRPQHLARVLENIKKNEQASVTRLIIYSDGAPAKASKNQKENIELVRTIIRSKKWCETVEIHESTFNKGLAASIIEGVDEVISRYGKVIVLEDDLLPSHHFLTFMNHALDKYQNMEEVISISAYVYPITEKLPETFFLRGADCWGWATWEEGWKLFRKEGDLLLKEIESKKLSHDFDFGGTYPYTQMLRDQVNGLNQSWAIRWYASAFLKDKLTLYPGRSLVHNIGIDGTGTHSGSSSKWDVQLADEPIVLTEIPIKENLEARRLFSEYFKILRSRPSFLKRILKKLSGAISK